MAAAPTTRETPAAGGSARAPPSTVAVGRAAHDLPDRRRGMERSVTMDCPICEEKRPREAHTVVCDDCAEYGVWCVEDLAWCPVTKPFRGTKAGAEAEVIRWRSGERAGVAPGAFTYEVRRIPDIGLNESICDRHAGLDDEAIGDRP